MAKKLTKVKAKKILSDGTAHGRKLTTKQRKFFGAIDSGTRKSSLQPNKNKKKR